MNAAVQTLMQHQPMHCSIQMVSATFKPQLLFMQNRILVLVTDRSTKSKWRFPGLEKAAEEVTEAVEKEEEHTEEIMDEVEERRSQKRRSRMRPQRRMQ